MTLVGSAADRDIVFTHQKEKSCILLDTRELKKQLDGVPLDTPEVLIWIREYLTEQYDAAQ